MALEDVAHERAARVDEPARAQAFDQPRQALAERGNARADGVGERLVRRSSFAGCASYSPRRM